MIASLALDKNGKEEFIVKMDVAFTKEGLCLQIKALFSYLMRQLEKYKVVHVPT